MSQGQNNTPLLLFRFVYQDSIWAYFLLIAELNGPNLCQQISLPRRYLCFRFFYDKLYNYLSRLLSCAFSGYCRLFLYMSSKHFVRQGKKAFVQQYQKLYRLLMKASMVFQYLQASKRRWLALHQILWSLLFQRLIVIPKVPFTFYIKSFAFGRLVFQ